MDSHVNSQSNGKVRFDEPVISNIHGRHSIATSHVPLLPPIASASNIPKQAFQMKNPVPGVDISAYFEHCRNVNEQQRSAYEAERKAWEIERTALRTKIADLEFRLNKANSGRRRLSNDSSYASASSSSYKSDFHVPVLTGVNGSRQHLIFNSSLDNIIHHLTHIT